MRVIAACLLAACSAAVFAQAAGKIRVEEPWARRAAAMGGSGAGNGAVYVMLVNESAEADALVAVQSDAAGAAEIHETYRDMGMMMMRPVKQIHLPAGRKVELKPGGYHIMLLGLKQDLKPGAAVKLSLRFEKAGAVSAEATVK
jgi:periplasmic copper chaperone A